MIKIIKSISLENYRGFKSAQIIELADTGNISFLIGQNNSGKSLLARALRLLNQGSGSLSDNDFHDADLTNPIKLVIEIEKKYLHDRNDYNFSKALNMKELFYCLEFVRDKSEFRSYSYLNDGKASSHKLTPPDNYIHYNYIYNSQFSSDYNIEERDVEDICRNLSILLKEIFLVFAPIRSFNLSKTDSGFATGMEIAHWIKENTEKANIKEAKTKVVEYLKQLNLDLPTDVSIDRHNDQMTFTFPNHLKLSSEDVGTGYTMLYILLMEIIRKKKKIIVIDEIESHLQPGLIRELIKIIRGLGECQYIIATHSPAVIESAKENDFLYRFQKINDCCVINKFYRNNTDAKLLRTVFNDIGVIPGDALLSNCVIWVEGPTEVLWLRSWMKHYLPLFRKAKNLNSNIIEGLHYSILMTGGGLIANISYSEENEEIDRLEEEYMLKVLRINPNAFVMIDSDNSDPSSTKYKRCLRIAKEINDQNSTNSLMNVVGNIDNIENLWLLKGRELENYCHPQLLKDFYTELSSKAQSKVENAASISNWDAYSISDGVGKILEDRGLTGVKEPSGTIKHKSKLASYVFNNFSATHFEKKPTGIEHPNELMIDNLTHKLTNLFDYLRKINSM